MNPSERASKLKEIFLCLLLISGICIAQEGRSFEDLQKAAHDGDLQASTQAHATVQTA